MGHGLLIVIIAICLFGCTNASSVVEASSQEKTDTFDALFACLHSAAKKLDDGRSDATSIAFGMRPICEGEFRRTRDIEGRKLNPMARRLYDQKDSEAFLSIATTVVLDERAKRR
jgi:hypothetical protein